MIVVFMVAITADVVMRNALALPIHGVSDFVAFAIVACVFGQLGSTIRDGRLIKADFLFGGWEDRRPLLANGAAFAFHLTGGILLIYAVTWLWDDFTDAWATSEFVGAVGTYQMILWPFKLAVLLGAAMAAAETLRIAILRSLRIRDQVRARDLRGLAGLAFLLVASASFAAVMLFGGLSPVQVGLMALAGLFILVACGMPVAFALLLMSFLGVWLTRGNVTIASNGLGIAMSGAVRKMEFGVVPLFVTMGLVLDRADVGRDAFQVAVVLLRRLRGGLGVATVFANAIFAAITGSSIASAVVFSRVAAPAMDEAGYRRGFATGVIAGSSVLGMLIPPSLLLIIYGFLAEVSVGALFLAAIIPGLILSAVFAAICIVMATWFPHLVGDTSPAEDVEDMAVGQMLLSLSPVAFIIVLVMGGIYGGWFSPTEAGAIGALGAYLVALARRKLDWQTMKGLVLETGYITASILFLIIAANFYGRMLALSRIPTEATNYIGALDIGLTGFVLCFIVLMVLLGMILDSVSIMLVILPIALPIVQAMGGDLVWFGIVTVIAVEMGLLTPPFGLSVFVVKGSLPEDFVTLGEIFRGAAPFVLGMLLTVLLLVFVPGIATVIL